MRCVLLLVLVLVAGCTSTAKGTLERMRKAGCASDEGGFFASVDESKLKPSVTSRAIAAATEDPAYKSLPPALQPAAASEIQDRLSHRTTGAYAELMMGWRDEVRKGEAGEVCKLKVLEAIERETTGKVHVTTGTGNEKAWVFSRAGDRWLLTDITGWP